MSLLRMVGKRHLELAKLWVPTGAGFSAALGGAFFYFTDWKAVLQYVPLYGSKFTREIPR
jgi:ubiquinol-cytochrome c reductase subunit 10